MAEKQEIFTLMGGKVRIHRGKYNPTSDAVWLAAMAGDIHAKTVLDVGIGTGGDALCMLVHNSNATVTGIDTSEQMLTECARNAELNNRTIELISADITSWRTARTFDMVISNPPYFKGTPAKHNAHHNADLNLWTRKCIARVKPRGYFCTIIDAASLSTVISAMSHACGDIYIMPLFGRAHTAERVLVHGRVGVRGGTTLHCGLSMNCDAVLRDGLTIGAALSRLNLL